MTSGRHEPSRVVFPDISTSRSSILKPSSWTTVGLTHLYNSDFVDNLYRARRKYAELDNDTIVPNSQPSSPSFEHRVSRLTDVLRASFDETPRSLPGMINLLCTRYPLTESNLKPKRRHGGVIFPLADDDAQWERWESGKEKPPPPSSSTLADNEKKFQLRTSGQLPVRATNPNPYIEGPPPKKRKLSGSRDEVRTASSITFPAVKRLTNVQYKEAHGRTSRPVSTDAGPSHAAPTRSGALPTVSDRPLEEKRPRPKGPASSGAVKSNRLSTSPAPRTVASQDVSLRIDTSPLHARSSMNLTFDMDSSIVSISKWEGPNLTY